MRSHQYGNLLGHSLCESSKRKTNFIYNLIIVRYATLELSIDSLSKSPLIQ